MKRKIIAFFLSAVVMTSSAVSSMAGEVESGVEEQNEQHNASLNEDSLSDISYEDGLNIDISDSEDNQSSLVQSAEEDCDLITDEIELDASAAPESGEPQDLAIIEQPQDAVSTGYSRPVTVSIKATGSGLTYNWQYAFGDLNNWFAFTADEGNGFSTITVPMTDSSYAHMNVRCMLKDSTGNLLISEPASLSFLVHDHDWAEEVTTEPGCKTEGLKTLTCTICGTTKTEAIPLLGHSWDDGVVTAAPTDTDPGKITYTCTRCHETLTEIIPAAGNTDTDIVAHGTCGETVLWKITKEGNLILFGTGEMSDFTDPHKVPWNNNKDSVKSIELQEGITSIGKYAFCTTKAEHVSLPSTLKKIGDGAFENLNIKEIALPDHLEKISWGAFWMTKLQNIVIPESVASIGAMAFYECQQLTSVSLPEGLEKIGEKTFYRCYRLKTINLPERCTNIDASAFEICSSLTAEVYRDSYQETFCQNNDIKYHAVCKSHQWDTTLTVDKEASCTEEGQKSIHCSACDAVKEGTVESIPALGHDWDHGAVTKPATCTEDGVKTYTCTRCQATRTEAIPATGHVWEAKKRTDKEPTCTAEGLKSLHCAVCGAVQEGTYETISELNHDWDEGRVTTAATCTRDGVRTYTCSRCHGTKTEKIPATGHIWKTEKTTDRLPGCTYEGQKSIHCSVCGAVKTGSAETIPALEHHWDNGTVTKEPTCTEMGEKTYTCSRCHETKIESISKNDHVWETDKKTDKEPTCTEEGTKSIHCSVCGAVKAGTAETIPALGHDWNKGTVTEEATEVSDGVKTFTCSRCGAIRTEPIPATGYDSNSGNGASRADQDFIAANISSVKNYILEKGETSQDNHAVKLVRLRNARMSAICPASLQYDTSTQNLIFVFEQKSPETGSTVKGFISLNSSGKLAAPAMITYTMRTGDTMKGTTVFDTSGFSTSASYKFKVSTSLRVSDSDAQEMLNSVLQTGIVEWQTLLAENFLDIQLAGIGFTNTCTRHLYQTSTLSEASCDTPGEEKTMCRYCGIYTISSISAVGHSWVLTVDKAATCTEEGQESMRCSVCKAVKEGSVKPIPALDHDWDNGKVTKAASCTAAGTKLFTCSRCHLTRTETVPATEHKWNANATVEIAAACTTVGKQSVHCSVCGAVKPESEQTIPALGHSWDEGKVAINPTCTQPGVKTFTCSRCGATRTESIPATGHSFSSWNTTVQPTITSEGQEARTCSSCGYTETRSVANLPNPAPTFNAGTVVLKTGQRTTGLKITNGAVITSVSTSNKKIVTISHSGNTITLKAGKKVGKAKVTINGKSITVKVQKPKVKTSKIVLSSGRRVNLKKGQSSQIKAVVAPFTSTDKISYSTNNKKVATVSRGGRIVAKKKGTAKITVKAGGKKVTVTVVVR